MEFNGCVWYAQSEKTSKIERRNIIKLINQWIQFLFPRRCPVCDEVLPVKAVWDISEYICGPCQKKLTYIKEPVCKKCGKEIESQTGEFCLDCTRKKHHYGQGKAVFVYTGPIRESLYRFKYSNRREYADFYAQEMLNKYQEWIQTKNIQVIIPIPLHRSRQRRRGYNQAELIADILGERMGIPVRKDILVRTKKTIPQKELAETERKNNLKNAFKISGNIVQLSQILLVDDIYTTGSTIDAAARTLKEAGGMEISFICVSIGSGL